MVSKIQLSRRCAPYTKAGAGSATLSMAAAAAQFAHSCLRAMSGERWGGGAQVELVFFLTHGLKGVRFQLVKEVNQRLVSNMLCSNSTRNHLTERGVTECAYVASSVTKLPFFATKVRLGASGVEQVMGLGRMTPFEKAGLEKMLPELGGSISKGVDFVKKK